MKKILETLLKLGITPIVAFIDSSRREGMRTIETEDQLSILSADVQGILISCGPGDMIALEFTNAAASFLESFLTKLGCGNDYKWIVTDKSRHFIYKSFEIRILRLNREIKKIGVFRFL